MSLFMAALRTVGHSASWLADRLLHSRRNRAAHNSLASRPRPRRILVVCHANLCRSPYLQAVLKRGLPDVDVISAGFAGSGRPVPPTVLEIGNRRGVDLSAHRSRPVTQSQVSAADLVIVMDAQQARLLATMYRVPRRRILMAGDIAPTFEKSRAIEDPYNKPPEVFRVVFEQLDRSAEVLIRLFAAKEA